MTDGPSRLERLLNLLALLLDAQRPLTRDEIVAQVSGYPTDPSASRRSFERDKETLRGLGVPLTVEPIATGESGELGYRVRPDDYYLPDPDLSAEETAALRIALSAVSLGAHEGEGALQKLGALGAAMASPIASLPLAPALADLFDASRRHATVTFVHRGERRELEPWALASRRGRWYVVGLDRGRGAVRSFRADRIDDVEVDATERFEVPSDFRADEHLTEHPWMFGDDEPVDATIVVDAGHTAGLEVALADADAAWEHLPDGSVRVTFPVIDRSGFRDFVFGFLEHAEVVSPPALRDEVIAWLEALVEEPA
ncbi:MAG TPA: WYL domain-containing protein [Acidimicrobiia bacterium]|nr:WYL domain-containing protein [Acidimicrobiia bacterium]